MMVWYSVEEICDESVYAMNASWDEIDRLVAQECADDYHHNHDGWECQSWPYTFALRESEDGPIVARFTVDREAVPSFTATLIAREAQ